MRRSVWTGLLLCAVAASVLFAEAVGVRKHTLWEVPWDHQGTLRVRPGDVIELWTRPVPLTAETLEAEFRASRSGRAVDQVGEALPRREGTMERMYYFKAFEPGSATLTVELLDAEGRVLDTWRYPVEVVPERVPEREGGPAGS